MLIKKKMPILSRWSREYEICSELQGRIKNKETVRKHFTEAAIGGANIPSSFHSPASRSSSTQICHCLLPFPLGCWAKPCEEGNSSFSKGIKTDVTAFPWLMPSEGEVALPQIGRDGQ
uniref:Uncharacterized protein n=1 Tax=Micrurus lemniscatus lemniscatus TaxID=129467 RepID=A0A2D4JL95_MICLE